MIFRAMMMTMTVIIARQPHSTKIPTSGLILKQKYVNEPIARNTGRARNIVKMII